MALGLLLVEGDAVSVAAMAEELREFDHVVAIVSVGRAALVAVDNEWFDAKVLDRVLSRLDGIAMLERLRASDMAVPIIMLSALGGSLEKVGGLEAGADDYVVEPIATAELNARLLALVRGQRWTAGGDTIQANDIVVSPTKVRAWRAAVALDLGKLEFKLLGEFVVNADAVLSRAMLVERVGVYDVAPNTNIVDVQSASCG